MPDNALAIVISLVAGSVAGVVFFGGLWFTVQRMLVVRHPALLMMASLAVRAAIVLAIFAVSSDGQAMRILASLGGFLLVRFVMVRHFEPQSKSL